MIVVNAVSYNYISVSDITKFIHFPCQRETVIGSASGQNNTISGDMI